MSSPDLGAEHVRRYRDRVFGERARLQHALGETAEWQRKTLTDLLEFNAGTEFGRKFGFAAIRTLDDYRRAVPVHDYAGLEPWIERMAAGERNVLTADDPVVYFTTSGSTGAHKKVPVTPRFMHTTFFPFFYAAWAPMVEHHPDVLAHPDAVLNLKHDPLPVPARTADGRPHLGASQVDFGAAFGEPLSAEPGSAAGWATLPVDVAADDHLEKAYLRLRLAVEADIRCVIGINPAAVAALPHQLTLWWPRILREVHDGTVGGQPVLPPNPERAAELAALARTFDPIRPAHVWPRLRVLFCWTGGVAALYLPRLREEFGVGVEVLPAPVAASEGPVGVTLDRHPAAASLVATAALYEFAPADEPIEPDVPTLRPDELEPDGEYQVIFSHVGGLYRYTTGDVVHVIDTLGGAPRIAYAGRATASDAAGERLRESHVVRALGTALDQTGLAVRNVSCRVAGTTPGYEFAVAPTARWSPAEVDRVTQRLDTALRTDAPGYHRARARGALATPRLRLVPATAFQRDWHARVAAGTRPAQVKDRLFRQNDTDWNRLVDPSTPKEGTP
ncbi:MAG TPA: GH3 auxin-responsive promoter family protein [Actinophytocola sp.]|uniref:GH3 family domain-containing protein n=1 Tax=Actinophytocola sp. TaxID=1872138 RepID=UPI002DB8DBC8|nr:GH3 auxin-responsive promoter family protein [Actinophytocola sp.]HEU5475254.1 GH3 auxin-responsive promoter family protein [Actinophytocola sp.]